MDAFRTRRVFVFSRTDSAHAQLSDMALSREEMLKIQPKKGTYRRVPIHFKAWTNWDRERPDLDDKCAELKARQILISDGRKTRKHFRKTCATHEAECCPCDSCRQYRRIHPEIFGEPPPRMVSNDPIKVKNAAAQRRRTARIPEDKRKLDQRERMRRNRMKLRKLASKLGFAP